MTLSKIACAGWLAALLLVGGCHRRPPPDESATLHGRVVSANGRALADARLALLTDERVGPPVRTGQSGSDGAFVIAGISAGTYLLRAELTGFSVASVPVTVQPREAITTVLRLEPMQLLEGVVQDGQGRPLAQAALFAFPLGGRQVGVVETQSGADGRFALAGLSPGPWTVMVEAPGFGTLRLERVDVPARPLVLHLEGEARTLGGVVLGPDGAPVVNARVVLGGAALSSSREVHSAAKGIFLFHGLGLGRFVLRATNGRQVSANLPVVIDDETGWLPPAKLTLSTGATLSGRVVDDVGHPLARAEVELVAGVREDDAAEVVRTDTAGQFTIAPVPAGHYQVWARLPGHAMATPPEVQLKADATAQVEVKLARAAQILGELVDGAGKAITGAGVVAAASSVGVQDLAVLPGSLPLAAEAANLPAEALAGKGMLRSVASDHAGRFLLGDLPAGQFRVDIGAEARLPLRKGPITLEPGRTVDLGRLVMAEGLPLKGRVVDDTGAPIAGARIEAREMDTAAATPFAGSSGPDGRFVLYVPRGRVSVLASAAKRAPQVRDGIVVQKEAAPPEIELRLARADAFVQGVVRDPQGKPATHARVMAFPLRSGEGIPDGGAPPAGSNQGTPLATASTDRSGRFRLNGVPRQPFVVEVRHPAWPTKTALATAGQELYIDLPRPGGVEGEVRDQSSGAYVSTYHLEALGPDGRPPVDVRIQGAGFELRGLLPGRWRLRVQAEGYGAVERVVDVPPGGAHNELSLHGVRLDLVRLTDPGAGPRAAVSGGGAP